MQAFEKGALDYQDSILKWYKTDKERKNTQEGDNIYIWQVTKEKLACTKVDR